MLLLCSDGRTGLCTQEDALASCRDSGAHPLGSSEDDGRDDSGDDGGVGSPQSSAGLDLTIGMQALIHPDSFSDDVGGVNHVRRHAALAQLLAEDSDGSEIDTEVKPETGSVKVGK